MKTTNTINTTNIRNINRVAEENLKQAIFAAAKESEPSAKQIARDQKRCAEREMRTGGKCFVTYHTWNWYKNLMDNLAVSEEYYTGNGTSEIDIVESVFRLAEHEEKFTFGTHRNQRKYYDEGVETYLSQHNYYDECIKLIVDAGLESEYNAWKAERQVSDCWGRVIRVGDIIRFPNITEICGQPIVDGFETKVTVDVGGNVLIAYPVNPWVEDGVLHVQGIPFTAELANRAEIIIRREEGFVRHPYDGFRLTCIEMPDIEDVEIFVKKS